MRMFAPKDARVEMWKELEHKWKAKERLTGKQTKVIETKMICRSDYQRLEAQRP
jgi:hypothetical protein